MGIITILMPPGSTVHDLKEKIMQWLEEISKEHGWNPPDSGASSPFSLTSAAPPPRVLGGGDDTTPLERPPPRTICPFFLTPDHAVQQRGNATLQKCMQT